MIKGDNGYISWEDNSIENLVDYINEQLNSRKMDLIEKDDFGVNKRVIEKRLARKGYKKVNGFFELKINNSNENSKSITDAIHKRENNSYTAAIHSDDSSSYTDDIHKENSESYTAAIQTRKVVENTSIMDIEVVEFLKDIKNEIQSIKQWQQERVLKDKVIDKVIEEYEEAKKKEQIIELEPVEIKLDEKIGVKGKAIGVRIDEEVYKDWVEFTKAHNKHFKSHQLLSQALIEFMKKYK